MIFLYKKEILKFKHIVVILLLILLGIGKVTYADITKFTVNPILPANQLEGGASYFNLLMTPGEEQKIQLQLVNSTSSAVKIDVNFSRASTSITGIAQYSGESKDKDSSLKYDLSNYVTYPKTIDIPAKSSTTMTANVRMPNESFKGVIAGGFTFTEHRSGAEHEESQNKSSMAVENVYSYTVALIIQQSKEKVAPVLKLNDVSPGQVTGRNVINVNLQNTAMAYLLKMNTQATVTGVSDPSIKFTYDNDMMQMAPNSNFNLPIPVSLQGTPNGQASKPLKPGKYHLHMTVYGEKSKSGLYQATVDGKATNYTYRWVFDKDFEVTAETANKLNQTDPTVSKAFPWIEFLGVGILILLILSLFLRWYFLRRKKNKEEE